MKLYRQPECLRRVEYASGLRRGETDAFAECVHRIHQSFRMQQGQPVADRFHVIIRAPCEFRRQGMCAQESGAYADTQFDTDAPCHAQHLALVVEIQAVARFYFQRGHAIGTQCAGAGQGLCEQFVLAGGAGRAHAGQDAATAACDLFVAGALQALFEFARAVSGKHHVGVAIHQAGRDPAFSLPPVACQSCGFTGQVDLPAHETEQAVFPAQRRVFDHAIAAVAGQRGQMDAGDQAIPGG